MGTHDYEREEAARRLEAAYVRDAISVDEYERLIGAVHDAKTSEDIAACLSGLPDPLGFPIAAGSSLRGSAAVGPSADADSVVCVGAVRTVSGRLLLARRLEIRAERSVVTLDYRQIDLPSGAIEINLDSTGSVLKLRLPATADIENRLVNEQSVVREPRAPRDPDEVRTLIVLTGTVRQSDLRIRRQRRDRSGGFLARLLGA